MYNQEVMERFFRSTNQQRAIDTMTAITFRRRALAADGQARRLIAAWVVQTREAAVLEETLWEQHNAGRKRTALVALIGLQSRWSAVGASGLIAAWSRNLADHRVTQLEARIAAMRQENAEAERSRSQLAECEQRLAASQERQPAPPRRRRPPS